MENILKYWQKVQEDDYFEKHPLGRKIIEAADPQIPREEIEGKTVLDFGCGFGRVLPYFLNNGAKQVIGIEVSEVILTKAKIWLKDRVDMDKVLLLTEDKLKTIPDKSVDYIHAHTVLQHMTPEMAEGYFTEFERIITPDANLQIQFLVGDVWNAYVGLPEPNFYWTEDMVRKIYKNLKIERIQETVLKSNMPGARWLNVFAKRNNI